MHASSRVGWGSQFNTMISLEIIPLILNFPGSISAVIFSCSFQLYATYTCLIATISTLINVRALLAHAELGVGLMGMHCTCGSNIKLIMHSRIARCRHINCLFKEGAAS